MNRLLLSAVLLASTASHALAADLSFQSVNEAVFSDKSRSEGVNPMVVKIQTLLDRQSYSPGVIDGLQGTSTELALRAFQNDHDLKATGRLDKESWGKLTEGHIEPVLTRYSITATDLKGPFIDEIPENIADMAKLDGLAFTGPIEALAERFHMDEDLLKRLNPDTDFARENTEIVVADVLDSATSKNTPKAAKIVVDKSRSILRALDDKDQVMAVYPATVGSEQNPAPSGTLKVQGVAEEPTWTYDPDLKLEGHKDRPNERLTIPAGPNNPVGAVWVDLNKEHYGIHGTPEPEKVGKSSSSGCVRLTNWDVQELAGMVKNGTPVEFVD